MTVVHQVAQSGAVVEGDTIIGWMENSALLVREVEVDGRLTALDLAPTALALKAAVRTLTRKRLKQE